MKRANVTEWMNAVYAAELALKNANNRNYDDTKSIEIDLQNAMTSIRDAIELNRN